MNLNYNYDKFLQEKSTITIPTGLEKIPELNPMLFDFQKDIVKWALRIGRAAIFADCGLGKTPMQLEWAEHVPGDVLLLAPLAVSQQTIREAKKFNIKKPIKYCRHQHEIQEGITITNYEMLKNFDASKFTGVILDESSILKSYTGKVRNMIIDSFKNTPFKLACTATPAPNDYMENGNHSEFLGILTRTEMLSMFFINDFKETQKWRLKGHAEDEYWKWLCSWAVMLRKPSDLGYEDKGFILPKIKFHEHIIKVKNKKFKGFFDEAITLSDRQRVRKESIEERALKCANEINKSDDIWLVWCNLNDESSKLKELINDSIEIKGSDSLEYKEKMMLEFSEGKIKCLITKPSISGFGMNWQHCHKMAFVGLSDSYEQFYQAVRRCWRFGQEKTVDVNIITADTEGAVVKNIKRKERNAMAMADNMVKHMKDINKANIRDVEKKEEDYKSNIVSGNNWIMHHGDCIAELKTMDSNSIHYTIFSPPFSDLYTYSDSNRDLGNAKNINEFFNHFSFLVKELMRVTKPGRLVSFHCMDLPTSKVRDRHIGIKDFSGDLIRSFTDEGWIYHSKVVIWKNPLIAAVRTKAIGLLHKQVCKDSTISRQGLPDYLITMRKPGINEEPVNRKGFDRFVGENDPIAIGVKYSHEIWRRYASPVWMDIDPSDTLQYKSARENKDEKHICPLQLGVIRRVMLLWSNEGDVILDPFTGIGSTGYVSLQEQRQFRGIELKESYFNQSVNNLKHVKKYNKGKSPLV
jgi:DNA modification methylase